MASFLAVPARPVSFGERLASSATFDVLFRDGMDLVEETAAYLDGAGREAASRLARAPALAYASESMRLTTRLMQIASWLLLQRAVNDGEMSADDVAADKSRTRAGWEGASAQPDATLLPAALLALVRASLDLQTRIQRLDAVTREPARTGAAPTALDAQRALLRQAFAS